MAMKRGSLPRRQSPQRRCSQVLSPRKRTLDELPERTAGKAIVLFVVDPDSQSVSLGGQGLHNARDPVEPFQWKQKHAGFTRL